MYRLVCYFTLPLGSIQVFLFILFSSFLLKYYITFILKIFPICALSPSIILQTAEGKGPQRNSWYGTSYFLLVFSYHFNIANYYVSIFKKQIPPLSILAEKNIFVYLHVKLILCF